MPQKDEQQTKDIKASAEKPFAKMTAAQKILHIGKVAVFLLSFGFAFPNIFGD
jgi:hypothetical protein